MQEAGHTRSYSRVSVRSATFGSGSLCSRQASKTLVHFGLHFSCGKMIKLSLCFHAVGTGDGFVECRPYLQLLGGVNDVSSRAHEAFCCLVKEFKGAAVVPSNFSLSCSVHSVKSSAQCAHSSMLRGCLGLRERIRERIH
jgi:hypothetical protein